MADFSLQTAPPQNAPPASCATGNGTTAGKATGSSPNLMFQQLLAQKTQCGNILDQLIPAQMPSDATADVSDPLQELAALLCLNPQRPLDLQILAPTQAAPAQQMPVSAPLIANTAQANTALSLPLQPDVEANPLIQTVKTPTQTVVQSTETFSLQKQGEPTAPLVPDVGSDADFEVLSQSGSQVKPLFQSVDHIPVKVGDTPTLDAQATDFPEQLSKQLSEVLAKGDQTLSLRLAPAELGTVTVEMTRSQDGSLHVVLKATSPAASNLLSDRAAELSGLLRSSTQNPVYVEVQQADSSQLNQQQQQGNARQQSQQQQQQQSHTQQQSQDFLEQLRLGLVPLDTEAS